MAGSIRHRLPFACPDRRDLPRSRVRDPLAAAALAALNFRHTITAIAECYEPSLTKTLIL